MRAAYATASNSLSDTTIAALGNEIRYLVIGFGLTVEVKERMQAQLADGPLD